MEITFLSTNTSEIHLHVEQLLQNTYWTLAEDLRLPKRQETPPRTWVGKNKKEKTETKEKGQDLHLWEGARKEEKFPHTRKLLPWWRQGVAGGWGRGRFGATEESAATGVWRAKRRDSRTEDRCRPALTSPRGLSAHPPGWAGAGSWGSGFGGQIPGRGLGLAAWTQPEGVSAPQLAGRESGKKSGPASEARDHCFRVREERGFRAPPEWAPETGTSHGYQRRHQRRAWNAKAAAAATKKPVCKHRSLSTPPLLGGCAAHHCQGPKIQGQLPWENARRASGCCNVTPASAAAGSPRILCPSHPRPEWARAPEAAAALTLSCPGRNRRPQATYMQRWGQIQSWTPGAVPTKNRKGNLSQQSQEQQIKSPQSTWCTCICGDAKHSKLNKMKRQRNTQQVKEQGKNPPDQTNEEEIGSLPEK